MHSTRCSLPLSVCSLETSERKADVINLFPLRWRKNFDSVSAWKKKSPGRSEATYLDVSVKLRER